MTIIHKYGQPNAGGIIVRLDKIYATIPPHARRRRRVEGAATFFLYLRLRGGGWAARGWFVFFSVSKGGARWIESECDNSIRSRMK